MGYRHPGADCSPPPKKSREMPEAPALLSPAILLPLLTAAWAVRPSPRYETAVFHSENAPQYTVCKLGRHPGPI